MRLAPFSVLATATAMTAFPIASALAADPLREGLEGALRGCETWVLHPASWTEGPAPFLAAIGLGDRVTESEDLPEPMLPPEPLRKGMRHWRIAAGDRSGYALTVSQDLPMCHIVGGGERDIQPAVEAALAASGFLARWEPIEWDRHDGIVSTFFRSREDSALTLVVSRADAPEARSDRPQVLATATYDPAR